MTPLLQNSSSDFTKVSKTHSFSFPVVKVFYYHKDYLYQEMELGEQKNGNHSSGGQTGGGSSSSKQKHDPVGKWHWRQWWWWSMSYDMYEQWSQ